MLANNETGVCQPVADVVDVAKQYDALHTDAVQALGKVPVSFKELGSKPSPFLLINSMGPRGLEL